MEILIGGALPPTQVAESLVPYFKPQHFLSGIVQQYHAELSEIDSAQTGCTAMEHHLLVSRGFKPLEPEKYVHGVSALASDAPTESCCRLDLCHLEADPQHSALIRGSNLKISKPESLALFESIEPVLQHRQIRLLHTQDDHAYVALPSGTDFGLNSAALMGSGRIHDHWPRTEESRLFRLIFSEIQMLLHDHPVNRQRQSGSLKPVNAVWIYGGCGTDRLPVTPAPFMILDRLEHYYSIEDWGGWLSEFEQLDQQLRNIAAEHTIDSVLLFSPERKALLSPPGTLQKLKNKFQSKDNWKKWWTQSS